MSHIRPGRPSISLTQKPCKEVIGRASAHMNSQLKSLFVGSGVASPSLPQIAGAGAVTVNRCRGAALTTGSIKSRLNEQHSADQKSNAVKLESRSIHGQSKLTSPAQPLMKKDLFNGKVTIHNLKV